MAKTHKRSQRAPTYLTISLDNIDRRALERAAKQERLSLADTTRRAIRKYAAHLARSKRAPKLSQSAEA